MNKFSNVFARDKDPFFAATLTYLIILLAFVGVRIFAQFGVLSPLGEYQDLVYSLIIQVGIIFGLSFICFKSFSGMKTKQMFSAFGFKKISLKSVLICVGIAICLIFLNTAFNSIYTFILSLFGYAPASSTITSYALPAFLLALFSSALLPGFCEEFANRGVLLFGLKNLGAKKAIVISGLLFGLMHLNVGQFGYAFLVGMFFAFICFATGSIIPAMIIHFLNNAIVEYLTFARVNDLPFGNYYSQISAMLSGDFFSSMAIIFVLLFGILFVFMWLVYLLIKDAKKRELKTISSDLAESLEGTVPPQTRIKISLPAQALGQNVFARQTYFPSLKQQVPMWCAVFLSAVITIMTLIWNTL